MKKTVAVFTLFAAALPFAAHADFSGPGAVAPLTTLAAVKKASNDAPVLLEGRIVRQLDHKHYEFESGGERINIKLKDKALPAEAFNANTKLRVRGEVDKELLQTPELEIKQVEILK